MRVEGQLRRSLEPHSEQLTKLESLGGEIEAATLVGAEHQIWGSGSPVFRVTRDVEASPADAVRAVVEERGDLSRVAVVVDDDGGLGREERVEASLVKSMRVCAVRSENEEVDNVDDADTEVGAVVLLEESGGGDDFLGQLVADADKDNIGVDSLVDGVVCDDAQRNSILEATANTHPPRCSPPQCNERWLVR